LSIVSEKMKVLDSYSLNSEQTGNEASVNVSTTSPITKKSNFIYFNTELLGSTQHKPIIRLNLISRKFVSMYKLSEKYKEGFWGAIHYDTYDYTYNKKDDLIVHSFHADEDVYVAKKDKEVDVYDLGSNHFSRISALYESIEVANPDPSISYAKAAQQGSYGYLIYDQYNALYYRIALLPISKKEAKIALSDPFSVMPQHSFIIADDSFSKLGETLMPRNAHMLNMFFITKEGFHIAKKQTENEDEIVFDIYKAEEIAND
jgi:hypothetical protein